MAEIKKKVKKIYTLDEIKFNSSNSTMALLSCIPIVGLVLMFVEKDDLFVRYHATQYALFNIIYVFWAIPFVGYSIMKLLFMIFFIFFVIGILEVKKGKRFDIPYISDLALKLMTEIG